MPNDGISAALDAIRRLVQGLRASARAAEQRYGITGAQLFVLQVLAEAPADSMNELAGRTFTHQSSVSVIVERLVRRRLVTRARSPVDARRVIIALTPAGRSLLRRAPAVAQIRLRNALQQLPARQRRTLARALDRLTREMGFAATPPALFFEDAARARRPRRASVAGTAVSSRPRVARPGAPARR